MVSEQAIRELGADIAREYRPERIILFGSYAYGSPTELSDVDLLVVMPYQGTPLRQAVDIAQRFRTPFALDVIVRTSDEIRQRLAWNDRFIKDVLARGRVLYATDDSGVGVEG